MMTPDYLIEQLLSSDGDFTSAYDGLVAAGAAAIPALTAAIVRGRGIPTLTAVVSALQLDDPVAEYAQLLDGPDEVHDVALRALGMTGDVRALPFLVDALPTDPFAAAEALGLLGNTEATSPLHELVRPHLGDGSSLPAGSALRSSSSCRNLRLVCVVAAALSKLGDHSLARVAIHLVRLRDDKENDAASLVRAAAARVLHHAVAPGVAAALHAAISDPDIDTARAALAGTLYLGRVDEVEHWLAIIATGGDTAANAAWCLAEWSGASLEHQADGSLAWQTAHVWWTSASRGFMRGVCYRRGVPVDAVRVAAALSEDPQTARNELHVRFAASTDPLLDGNPASAGEQAKLAAWTAMNASRFPPGKLHRAGRTYEPSAVDG